MLRYFYLFLFLIFYIFLLVKCQDTDDNLIKSFIKTPSKITYYLGESVTLTCKLKVIENSKIVVFRKEKSMKSEGCTVFDNDKYDMECLEIKEGGEIMKIFKYKIKTLSWEDRGNWECFYAQNIKAVSIDIRVSPIFDKLQISVVPISAQVKDNVENIKPHLMGRGSRTNPYNLQDGATINITCFSSCSYPETIHKWIYKNSTQFSYEIKVFNQKRRDLCNLDHNKGMAAAESEVTINCSTLKIVGANIVMCSSNNELETKNASIYILCPGGERPWELTTGEMVGVAVSVGIFVLLIVFLFLLIKRSKYVNVPGEASANTYSSGVKV